MQKEKILYSAQLRCLFFYNLDFLNREQKEMYVLKYATP